MAAQVSLKPRFSAFQRDVNETALDSFELRFSRLIRSTKSCSRNTTSRPNRRRKSSMTPDSRCCAWRQRDEISNGRLARNGPSYTFESFNETSRKLTRRFHALRSKRDTLI